MQSSMAVAIRTITQDMVWWRVMPSNRMISRRVAFATAACSALLLVAAPSASPAPPFDSQGYVDSTARCTAPDTAVVFGSTASSRVAICRSSDGDYEYRGVRVRDGAKLIAAASRSSDGAFTATNDGIDYLVTSSGTNALAAPRIATRNTHGTGCSLSSAIAAGLAKGEDMETAVRNAKAWVSAAIAAADRFSVGHGHGPVHHFHQYY